MNFHQWFICIMIFFNKMKKINCHGQKKGEEWAIWDMIIIFYIVVIHNHAWFIRMMIPKMFRIGFTLFIRPACLYLSCHMLMYCISADQPRPFTLILHAFMSWIAITFIIAFLSFFLVVCWLLLLFYDYLSFSFFII